MSLNEKQSLFVQAYIANRWNATQAALDAGYSENSAYQQAHALLKNVEIQAAISQAVKDKAKALGFDANRERIIQELCSIAFSDPVDLLAAVTDLESIKQLPPHTRACISKIQVRPGRFGDGVTVELHSKTTALDMLSKILGAYAPEKLEANVSHTSEEGSRLLAGTSREEQDILTRVLSRSDRGVTN